MEIQSLRMVKVNLLKIKVKNYFPNKNRAVLEIFFHDGKLRQMTRSIGIGNPNALASQLMEELTLKERNDSVDFDGESLVDVEVAIKNENKIRKLLIDFFRTLHSKAHRIRKSSTSSGYIDLIRNIQATELSLDDK